MRGLPAAGLTAALAAAAAADSLSPVLAPGLLPLLLLGLTALAAAVSGRRLVGALSVGLAEDELTVAGTTAGLGALALATLALASVGLLKPWAASALLGAALLWGWSEARPALASAAGALRRAAARPWLCAAVALPLALALWACLVPPHQYDSLVYHLALPQEYLRTGRLHAVPGVVYTHFPQNGEMLFALALALGSDLLAQMLVWLATALAVAWLLVFGRRLTPAAPWAALLLATHTAVLLLSSTTYVEPLVMLWTTGALLSFETGRPRLAAVFTGLALGTKYYAGLLAIALMARLAWDRRFREAAIFCAIAGALFAPWLAKNWLMAGNPVFPFLYRVFPATKAGWPAELAAGYFAVLTEYGHGGGWVKDLVSLPMLLFRNPLRFGGGMDVLGDLGWDLTLWLWPAGLWAAWRGKGPRGLAAATALYAAGWFATGVVLRFLTALAPVMALVGAAGAASWRRTASTGARSLAAAAAAALVAAHLFLAAYVHGVFGSQDALLGLQGRSEFLARRLEYYPCAAAAVALPADARVLLAGEQRGYYLERPRRASTVHAPNPWAGAANAAASPVALAAALRAQGWTHALLVPREAARLAAGFGLDAAGAANLAGLDAVLAPVARGPGCVLGALVAR